MEDGASESAPLLGGKGRPSRARARAYLTEKVRVKNAYIPLLICCFLTGLIDAASYSAWSVFMGMQTGTLRSPPLTSPPPVSPLITSAGNTIFLALSTFNLPPGSDSLKWARSLVSIASLIFGSLLTGRLYSRFTATRRATLICSFFAQTLFIAIAALLVHTDAVPESPSLAPSPFADGMDKRVMIAIPFLAAQSGAQVVTAKSLGFGEVPTTVLTSVYSDLGADVHILGAKNWKRDRRVGAAVMMLMGGICAGWISTREGGGLRVVLWLGAGIKFLLGLGWLIFQAEGKGDNDDA
ncbi:hypothetical protein G7Y79_00049g085150 [Physcia stellaris]|nr:hypothetical protein G7Y79_00049g085150 [Physcia stellaris]